MDAAWTDGVELTPAARESLETRIVERYQAGEEACGYIVGPAEPTILCDEVVPLVNMIGKMHARDPVRFPRGPRTAFAFSLSLFERAIRVGRMEGRPVKVLFHSHLDAPAHLGATDRAMFSQGHPPRGGRPGRLGHGPIAPLLFLVTSVGAEGIVEHRGYRWRDGDFVATPVRV